MHVGVTKSMEFGSGTRLTVEPGEKTEFCKCILPSNNPCNINIIYTKAKDK